MMTKKDLLLETTDLAAGKPVGLTDRLLDAAPLKGLARLYGSLLERKITPRQTLHLLHVQAAGAVLVLPVTVHAGFLLLALAWLGLAAWQCRRSLLSDRN